MEDVEKIRLFFKSGSHCADTEKKDQIEGMAMNIAININKQLQELIEKFNKIRYENLDDAELGRWITLQTMLPLSSLMIRTFTAVPAGRSGFDTYMEKMWAAIEGSRLEKESQQ